MNHAERQRIKEYRQAQKIGFKLGLSYIQCSTREDRDWYFEMYRQHGKNWHIILRKIEKELDDERGR